MPERPDRFYCSLASRANNEALAGTVAQIRSWLLIEHASVWRRSAVDGSRLFSRSVKTHLRTIGVERTLLVRQIHRASWPARVMFVDSSADGPSIRTYEIEDYGQLWQMRPGSVAKPASEVMFAVCTHARHDKCCSRMPVWCALRDHIPKRTPYRHPRAT